MRSDSDVWSEWLLNRRFGGDPARMRAMMTFLRPIRDKVLERAALREQERLLDVGCGDGLIAFGALEAVEGCRVIFSDVSEALLQHASSIAGEMGLLDRCRFVNAPAENLSAIADASVDAVTTRSVLIYVEEKQAAFNEMYRVLKPGGRLSLFEPINRFTLQKAGHLLSGYDVTPVKEIARKVRALYERIQPPDSDPMLNFDERDLLSYAEKAGFMEIHLELQAEIKAGDPWGMDWEAFLHTAPNPKIPTIAEAVQQTLTDKEAQRFCDHLRPLVEKRQRVTRQAFAYLWAYKHPRRAPDQQPSR